MIGSHRDDKRLECRGAKPTFGAAICLISNHLHRPQTADGTRPSLAAQKILINNEIVTGAYPGVCGFICYFWSSGTSLA